MSNSGLPTPDNFVGNADFVCIPIIVPNKTEFKAAIYGLYGQMCNDWFWKQAGTMTPETASFLSAEGLGQTEAYGACGAVMACADVADCFESEIITNVTLQTSVTNYVNSAGFGNPNRIDAENTKIADRNVSGFNEQKIKTQSQCNLDALWAGIRYGIVQRMDDLVRDTLEDLAVIPELGARVSAFIDIIPVVGDVVEATLNAVASAIPTLLDLYNAHSSEATLDEIACDLFSLVCAECRYPTHAELYNYYQSFAMPATPSISDFVLDVMMQLLSNPVGVVAKVAYFTLQVWALGILYLQALFHGENGSETLYNFATLGEDFANDNWLQLCNACGEQYMEYVFDFTKEQYDSYRTGNFSGSIESGAYISGKGWHATGISGTDALMQVGLLVDATWQFVAIAYQASSQPGAQVIHWRPTPGSNSGAVGTNMNLADAPYTQRANLVLAQKTGFKEVAFRLAFTLAADGYLQKVAFKFNAGSAPIGSTPVASPNYLPL